MFDGRIKYQQSFSLNFVPEQPMSLADCVGSGVMSNYFTSIDALNYINFKSMIVCFKRVVEKYLQILGGRKKLFLYTTAVYTPHT